MIGGSNSNNPSKPKDSKRKRIQQSFISEVLTDGQNEPIAKTTRSQVKIDANRAALNGQRNGARHGKAGKRLTAYQLHDVAKNYGELHQVYKDSYAAAYERYSSQTPALISPVDADAITSTVATSATVSPDSDPLEVGLQELLADLLHEQELEKQIQQAAERETAIAEHQAALQAQAPTEFVLQTNDVELLHSYRRYADESDVTDYLGNVESVLEAAPLPETTVTTRNVLQAKPLITISDLIGALPVYLKPNDDISGHALIDLLEDQFPDLYGTSLPGSLNTSRCDEINQDEEFSLPPSGLGCRR